MGYTLAQKIIKKGMLRGLPSVYLGRWLFRVWQVLFVDGRKQVELWVLRMKTCSQASTRSKHFSMFFSKSLKSNSIAQMFCLCCKDTKIFQKWRNIRFLFLSLQRHRGPQWLLTVTRHLPRSPVLSRRLMGWIGGHRCFGMSAWVWGRVFR